MKDLLIKNVRIIENGCIFEDMAIKCRDGMIHEILPAEDAGEGYDAGGLYLAPGYIDLHFHGIKGHSTDTAESIAQITEILPRFGVTGFLPTVGPKENKKEDIEFFRSISVTESKGANILGVLLEGHFLTLTGAFKSLPEDKDNKARVKEYIDALNPYKAIFCISPEFPEMDELLPLMTVYGIPAFVTHTIAEHQETQKAIELGATHATHFYDVFPYKESNEPGVRHCGSIEAFYANPDTTLDFVLDGEHVDPVAVKMAIACKGTEKISLITDANSCSGLPPGRYSGIMGYPVEVFYEGGPARLTEESHNPGCIAGSGLTMEKAVKNAIQFLGVSLPDAVSMASTNPASVLGLSLKKGRIKCGYDADFILLTDELDVAACVIGGNLIFSSGSLREVKE